MQSQVYKVIDLITISIYDQEFIIYIEYPAVCTAMVNPASLKSPWRWKYDQKSTFWNLTQGVYTGYTWSWILSLYELFIWFFRMSNVHNALRSQFNEQAGFNDCFLLSTARHLLIVHENSSFYMCMKSRWWRQDGAVKYLKSLVSF